jgi:hypothetical protein
MYKLSSERVIRLKMCDISDVESYDQSELVFYKTKAKEYLVTYSNLLNDYNTKHKCVPGIVESSHPFTHAITLCQSTLTELQASSHNYPYCIKLYQMIKKLRRVEEELKKIESDHNEASERAYYGCGNF